MSKKDSSKEKLSSEWKILKDKYKLITVVGEGTFGKVVKARNRETEKLVAIKLITGEFKTNNTLRNVIRELQIIR